MGSAGRAVQRAPCKGVRGMSPMYKTNWEKPFRVIAFITIALCLSIGLRLGLGINPLTNIFFIVTICLWGIFLGIIICHFSSSIKIENGLVSHLVFGITKSKTPIEDLLEYKEEKSIFPGKLIFKNGFNISVSGMAIGKNENLPNFLRKYNNEIKISL